MTGDIYFTPRTKFSELINANYRLLFILPRFGIKLGLGESSVAEVCERAGIDINLFLLVCNIYSNDELPDLDRITDNISIEGIVRYLHNSHLYYIDGRMPELDEEFRAMLAPLNEKARQPLVQFYENYRRELLSHFDYEEHFLFPYVLDVVNGKKTTNYNIRKFEKNHGNIEEKLDDLKNIIIKYLPESSTPDSTNQFYAGSIMLVDLFRLGDDLQKHTYIEDRILVPLVSKLERS